MKIFLISLFCFFSTLAFSQTSQLPLPSNPNTEVIMTKEKHDQLKKNIEDYKILISKYYKLAKENVDLKNQNKIWK